VADIKCPKCKRNDMVYQLTIIVEVSSVIPPYKKGISKNKIKLHYVCDRCSHEFFNTGVACARAINKLAALVLNIRDITALDD